MKDIITKLYAVCINKRQFSSPREDKKNGWYGTMFRGLDMSQVVAMKSELEAMVQRLGVDNFPPHPDMGTPATVDDIMKMFGG